ncbi:MAG TPA: VIT domain-containing protein [Pyrinomonadaceae bacterium]
MRPRLTLQLALLFATVIATLVALATLKPPTAAAQSSPQTPGALQIVGPDGKAAGSCPLKHTDVRAEISGFLSRVTVTQEFENPHKDKIEAVYVFPLPQMAAVDDMTMTVGERTVKGKILPREEARTVYEAARATGRVAGLLDQERPNIFTQSVANIMPGERVTIKISYVETLKYDEGTYEFSFPMVVGPRYNPGSPTGRTSSGFAPDTDRVPDASRITPVPESPGTRAGHDISVEVALDAGVPLDSLRSTTHEVDVERVGASGARVRLKNHSTIPNKDFILSYDVAGRKVSDALLTHRGERGGFFTFILQPPDRVTAADVTPKELVFVLDTSGSMSGFPIDKAKEAMRHALAGLYPQDTFNLITFAGDTHVLFPAPVPATPENLSRAQRFLETRSGGGGTEMMKAIKTALDPSDSQSHVRIVCFMTDGYVGNDMEIVSEIQKHPNARVFSFGIGSSVNRFLLDKMAEAGRGEVEYVALNDDGSAAAMRFHKRVREPLLTDISIEWGGLNVADIYPRRIPDLFSAKPVVVTGRYVGNGRGRLRLTGRMSGKHFEREIPVELPEAEARHDVLATLWARTRIDDLTGQDYAGIQQGNARPEIRQEITQLGLEFRLMTQFTSFIAVEEMTITDGGPPRRVDVPIEMPEGVNNLQLDGTQNAVVSSNFSIQQIQSLPMSARKVSNTMRASRPAAKGGVLPVGSITETVTVTAAESHIDMTSSSATTTVYPPPAPPGDRKDKPGREEKQAAGTGEGRGASERVAGPTAEEVRRQQIIAKMHASLAAVVERLWKNDAKPGAEEVKFVREGKAEVQVWLTDKSDATMAKLKALGFEIILDPKSGKVVIGRLPLEKLVALAEIKEVRYVAPQTAGGR